MSLRRILVATCVAWLTLLPAMTAWAVPGTVRLKNGGWIEGEIVEVLPGESVTVRGPYGATKKIPWAEVERVDQAQAAPAAPAEPAPAPGATAPAPSTTPDAAAPAPTAPATEPAPQQPMFALENLQTEQTARGYDAETAPSGSGYRGESLADLEQQRRKLSLGGPLALTIAGGVIAINGAALLVYGLIIEGSSDSFCDEDDPYAYEYDCDPLIDTTPFIVAGGVALGLGTIGLAVGVPMLTSRMKERRELGIRIQEKRRYQRSMYREPSDGPRLARSSPVLTVQF